jgi:formate hydrogenlyase subunit 6/NADH:ubiquinone oxidoreductase subunit I
MAFFTMAGNITKNLFAGPSTRPYPKKKRDYTPITRGHIEIDINICIFCGLCARRCPTTAIVVTKDAREWEIDRLRCCSCNYCVEVCPVHCLRMENQYTPCMVDRSTALHKEKQPPKAQEEKAPAPENNPS